MTMMMMMSRLVQDSCAAFFPAHASKPSRNSFLLAAGASVRHHHHYSHLNLQQRISRRGLRKSPYTSASMDSLVRVRFAAFFQAHAIKLSGNSSLLAAGASVRHHRHHDHHLNLQQRVSRRGFHRSPQTSASMESSEGLAAALWRSSRKQAMLALYHPFVVSLAAGVLKIESFRNYIAQDAFFLKVFAEAYGLALENTDDETSRSSICQLQQAVIDELKLHSSYAKAWGVDITKECKPNRSTVRYTEFLLATATGKESLKIPTDAAGTLLYRRRLAALTIGAMTPCMRLYAFLGNEISKSLGDKRSRLPYHDWVDTYSSEAFQASTFRIEQLLNSLADCLGEDDVRQLKSVYNEALKLELEFFSAQPDCQLELVPFFKSQVDSDYSYHLVSDFDSTCSVADSCPVLAEVSIKAAAKLEEDGEIASKPWRSSADLRKLWDKLEKAYNDEYTSLLSSTLPSDQVSIFRSYDHEGLKTFLEQLSQVESQANTEVVEAGVLKGLDLSEVRKAGAEMVLQEGCGDFFRSALNSELTAHIISLCWSRTFIEAALSRENITSVTVHSNELMGDGGCTSGNIDRMIETPLDKERVFQKLRMDLEKNRKKPVLSVYIGDSVTDLLCLLDADLGIIVGSRTTLKKVAQAFGVALVPLYQGILDKKISLSARQNRGNKSGVLYTVKDWHEIHACLLGMP